VLVPIRHRRISADRARIVYRRQDGSTLEPEQRISEDSLVSCPTTGQQVERVLQPFTPRDKGTGFYSTDHRRSKAKEQPKDRGGK
jgi:predicted nucleic acid-binding Zn ribbon protein